ncbi:MAG: tetratricopeptide repeat protein, partial [Magnetococcales bacterium]|nr:tetratricopeptide repeat protein [Magnetococcales bacterium]
MSSKQIFGSDSQPQMTNSDAYLLATNHFLAERYVEAYQTCSAIILSNPNHIDAINLLGVIAQKIGRHDLAAEQFLKAININGNIAKLYFNLGTSLLPLERKTEAISCYKKAIELQPELPEFHYNLANILKSQKKFDKAIASYKTAISIQPDFLDAHFHLGSTLTECERFDEAIVCFQKSLAIKPDFPEAEHLLNALTNKTSASAPKEYVRGVFNSYADNFESHLIKILEYKTPALIRDTILDFRGED